MRESRVSRPPLAAAALGVIIAITAGWWALALWPLDPTAPEWLTRTREVCFGATSTGLPHMGGWLLLIGEPLGLLLLLAVVWGRELREDLASLWSSSGGRTVVATVAVLCGVGLLASAKRVAAATWQPEGEPFTTASALPARDSLPGLPLALLDQHGTITTLDDYRGRWVIVTFAFGHCDDICPVIVDIARRARDDAGIPQVPVLVVSLDPWRDTPDRLASIAGGWGMAEGDRILSGPIDEVNAALDAWSIRRARNQTNGDVVHGSTIVVIDPEGRIAWRLDGAPHRVREAMDIVAAELSSLGG